LYTANLQFAKDFFEDKIKDFSKKELDTLLYKILNGLKFHIYEIDEEIDVFLRFETLNNRGKPLSKLELLKNRLIYLTTLLPNKGTSKNELRQDINEVWKQVYEHLGKNKGNPLDDEHFLENHWIMYFKTEKGESENYLRFLLNEYFIPKNVLDNESKIGFGEIKSYVDSMSESVRKWFAIFNPSFSDYSEETKEWLQRLNRTGFGAFKPLIMAAMVKRIDEEKLIALLKSAQRFELTMYRLVMTKSKYRDSHFYRMANDLYHEKDERTIDDIIEDINMQKEREVFSLFHMGKSDVSYPTIG